MIEFRIKGMRFIFRRCTAGAFKAAFVRRCGMAGIV